MKHGANYLQYTYSIQYTRLHLNGEKGAIKIIISSVTGLGPQHLDDILKIYVPSLATA